MFSIPYSLAEWSSPDFAATVPAKIRLWIYCFLMCCKESLLLVSGNSGLNNSPVRLEPEIRLRLKVFVLFPDRIYGRSSIRPYCCRYWQALFHRRGFVLLRISEKFRQA